MRNTRFLDDEHMRLYEWCGAGTGMQHHLPTGSKRDHAWHASYGVLAVLTSLLILGGCNEGSAEMPGGTAEQAAPETLGDPGTGGAAGTTMPVPADAGGQPDGGSPAPSDDAAQKP